MFVWLNHQQKKPQQQSGESELSHFDLSAFLARLFGLIGIITFTSSGSPLSRVITFRRVQITATIAYLIQMYA